MTHPTITETHGHLTCGQPPRHTHLGVPVEPNAFLPMTAHAAEEDPGWFSGVALTDPQHTPASAGSTPAPVTEEVDRGVSDDH